MSDQHHHEHEDESDFARGQDREHDESRPGFASGQRTQPPTDEEAERHPDFARGQETGDEHSAEHERHGSFATGQETEAGPPGGSTGADEDAED